MQRTILFPAVLAVSVALPGPRPIAPPASAQTVASPPSGAVPTAAVPAIMQAGHLRCATVGSEDDWNGQDQHGDLSVLGAAVCHAVAAAILGDASKVEIAEMPAEPEALAALRSGSVDLALGISPSAETAVQWGVGFGPAIFYDTQRFMVPQGSHIAKAADLRDALICAMNNTPAERTLRDEMTAREIPYALQAHSEQGEMDASVGVARCAAGTALESRLAASRADFPATAPPFNFLPERLGLSPVVPAYRYGDQRLGLIVDYTVHALVEAEALGITQANVEAARARTDMRAQRLLGGDRAVGQALGLGPDWVVRVIAAVGNYGEIFNRTLGKTYGLDRGLNALWTAGGLMHPAPLQ